MSYEEIESRHSRAALAQAEADETNAKAGVRAEKCFDKSVDAAVALLEGDVSSAIKSGASALFNGGAAVLNGANAHAQEMDAKRFAESARTMDSILTAVLRSEPEPSPKFSPEWYLWYANEYDIWRQAIITNMGNLAEEHTKKGVYEKRLYDIQKVIYSGFQAKEVGLCVLEVWNSPLPLSRLDFGTDDAIRMFSAGGKLVRNRIDLRRIGLTILPDSAIESAQSEFDQCKKRVEENKPISCICFSFKPNLSASSHLALPPMAVPGKVVVGSDKDTERAFFRYRAFLSLAYEKGFAIDEGVLALQSVVLNEKAKVLGLTLVDLRALRPDDMILKSA
jgi:hypothetical protein